MNNEKNDLQTHTNSLIGALLYFLMLRKGVYSYQYMESGERFNETKLPIKK